MNKENKNPLGTIYQCLSSYFWTRRKCWDCQQVFTKEDYQQHNYYLTFQEILNVWESEDFPEPRDHACLEGVVVKLFHQHCQKAKYSPNECQFEIIKDITCK